METLGQIFISDILTEIDNNYEDRNIYDFAHLDIYQKQIKELDEDIFDVAKLKEHLSKKINDAGMTIGLDIVSSTLLIFHKIHKNLDFIAFTSLFSTDLNQNYTLVTYSPGSVYDLQSDLIDMDISNLEISRHIKKWKENVIRITKSQANGNSVYETIYSEINKQFPNDSTLDDVISSEEVNKIKEELDDLKIKFKNNEDWTKQQIEEFNTILDELTKIKPLDTKKQWFSKLMVKTTDFVQKHPTTSGVVFFNLTNGFSSINSIPTAYIADKALQLGIPKDDIDKSLYQK